MHLAVNTLQTSDMVCAEEQKTPTAETEKTQDVTNAVIGILDKLCLDEEPKLIERGPVRKKDQNIEESKKPYIKTKVR